MEKQVLETKKKKISVLDIFAVLLIIMCVTGAILRIFIGGNGIVQVSEPESDEYCVSFNLNSIRTTLASSIVAGDSLYDDNGNLIGTVDGNLTVTPALVFKEDSEGKLIQTYSNAENGDNSLVDVTGTITVKGYYSDYGFTVAGSKVYLAPNYSIQLHSGKMISTFKIADIEKNEK